MSHTKWKGGQRECASDESVLEGNSQREDRGNTPWRASTLEYVVRELKAWQRRQWNKGTRDLTLVCLSLFPHGRRRKRTQN